VSQVVGTRPIPTNFKPPLSLRHYVEWYDTPAEEIRATSTAKEDDLPQHNLILGNPTIFISKKRQMEAILAVILISFPGDFSPSYMYDFDAWRYVPANEDSSPKYVVADLIKTINPGAKILLMLRNPIDRYRTLNGPYHIFQNSLDKNVSDS
jgi:hypothetical protein